MRPVITDFINLVAVPETGAGVGPQGAADLTLKTFANLADSDREAVRVIVLPSR